MSFAGLSLDDAARQATAQVVGERSGYETGAGGRGSKTWARDRTAEDLAREPYGPQRANRPLGSEPQPRAPRRSPRVIFRSHHTRLVLMEIDLAAIILASALATGPFIYLHRDAVPSRWGEYAKIIIVSLPGWVLAFCRARLYTSRFLARGVDEARRLAYGVAGGAMFLALASVVIKVQVERSWYVVVALAVFVAVGAERIVVRAEFARRRRCGSMCRPVVLVGTNAEGNAIEELFHSQPQLGYYVVARVRGADVDVSEDPSRPDTRVIDGPCTSSKQKVRAASSSRHPP